MKNLKISPLIYVGAAAILAFVLLSPKWLVPAAAWIAPGLLIFLSLNVTRWKAFGLSFLILLISGLIANYKVMPFPVIFFVIISIQTSLLGTIPYVLNRLITPYVQGWKASLIFPCLAVGYEYGSSFLAGGTWGSISYTQMENAPLTQLASLSGMWGISFLVYWFSSLTVWLVKNRTHQPFLVRPAAVFSSILIGVYLYGVIRTNSYFETKQEATVRVAGISGQNLAPVVQMYQDEFGKIMDVKPETLSQTSPELQELQKGLAAFIENPFDAKFISSWRALDSANSSFFRLAEREARAGAKIISFSEALMFTVKPKEHLLIEKGRQLAKQEHVVIVLSIGSFIPGKIEEGSKYIENKTIFISDEGEVLNIFFKNKPVPIVEGSIAGDGTIPVIRTKHGDIATSICYDADFPSLMQQAGILKAGLLILPSGDWKEVSPYHSHMARMRAIENGFSLLRPVSGATSIISDSKGRVIASRNFYDQQEKVVTAWVPIQHHSTLYSIVGDAFAWLCIAFVSMAMLALVAQRRGYLPAVEA
jgi:apolipoprotein N-acyltransferase